MNRQTMQVAGREVANLEVEWQGQLYPDRGNFIGLVANRASNKLLNKVAKAFAEARTIPVRGLSPRSFTR